MLDAARTTLDTSIASEVHLQKQNAESLKQAQNSALHTLFIQFQAVSKLYQALTTREKSDAALKLAQAQLLSSESSQAALLAKSNSLSVQRSVRILLCSFIDATQASMRQNTFNIVAQITTAILQQRFPRLQARVTFEFKETKLSEYVTLGNEERRRWRSCSQGERETLCLVLGFAVRRLLSWCGIGVNLLLLDEVLAHVDAEHLPACLECIWHEACEQSQLLGYPLSVLIVSHAEILSHLQRSRAYPDAREACSDKPLDHPALWG
jgi:hypothetical protein